jgi:hypothetical protein
MEALLTVGSTEFTALVQATLDQAVLDALRRQGFTKFLLQVGRSALPPRWTLGARSEGSMTVELVDFTPDIETRMAGASLIVCHAGSSTRSKRGPLSNVSRRWIHLGSTTRSYHPAEVSSKSIEAYRSGTQHFADGQSSTGTRS